MSEENKNTQCTIDAGWLIAWLLANGASKADLGIILSGDTGSSSGAYLNLDQYFGLWEWAAQELKRPHIGIDVASGIGAGDLGLFGYLTTNTETLEEFYLSLVRYQPILCGAMSFEMRDNGDLTEVMWDVDWVDSSGVRHDTELSFTLLMRTMRYIVGEDFTPVSVLFTHEAAAPKKVYRHMFGCTCLFGQPRDSFIFPAELLSVRLPNADQKLFRILKSQADDLLRQWESHQGFVNRVKVIIAMSLEHGEGGVEEVARKFNTTSRTLSRRLAREGKTYQQLREGIVFDAARKALADSDAPITLIAGRLGFSESSAFVRAFRRLSGMTPTAYRRQARRG